MRTRSRPTDERIKADGTPTTGADLAAETLIITRLNEAWSGIPVVAEETANAQSPEEVFFLVDPLDGTGDYIHRTGEYTVNIALIRGGRPLAAVVSAPAGSGSPARRPSRARSPSAAPGPGSRRGPARRPTGG